MTFRHVYIMLDLTYCQQIYSLLLKKLTFNQKSFNIYLQDKRK
nr:MAG TPA: hypothetical protein [Caudoviricetes sp.]